VCVLYRVPGYAAFLGIVANSNFDEHTCCQGFFTKSNIPGSLDFSVDIYWLNYLKAQKNYS
jgi:hypothetical protein